MNKEKLPVEVELEVQIYEMFRGMFRNTKELESSITHKEYELNELKESHKSQLEMIGVACEQYGFEIKSVDRGDGAFRDRLMPSEKIKAAYKKIGINFR